MGRVESKMLKRSEKYCNVGQIFEWEGPPMLKISSKAIAMRPIYYESASKNILMSTFWEDSENIDFFIKVCLNFIFIKLENHENIIESDCYETYILWISIEKYTYEHILRGFGEHWFFHQGLLELYLYKARKSRKYHRKRLLWDLYIMNQHRKIYLWAHFERIRRTLIFSSRFAWTLSL